MLNNIERGKSLWQIILNRRFFFYSEIFIHKNHVQPMMIKEKACFLENNIILTDVTHTLDSIIKTVRLLTQDLLFPMN